MPTGPTPKVLELVVFELNEGTTLDAFLATEAAMAAWIQQQPGFMSYDLLLADDAERWVFVGWWDTMAAAKAAAEAAQTADGTAPMFALIDFEARSYLYLHTKPAVRAAAMAKAARAQFDGLLDESLIRLEDGTYMTIWVWEERKFCDLAMAKVDQVEPVQSWLSHMDDNPSMEFGDLIDTEANVES